MLSVIDLCTKKKTHKVKVNIATVAPEFNVTMAKTKVSKKKKKGKELCTVSIFKKNTRTKMFLLNQILFFLFSGIQQNKFYKIKQQNI